MVLSQQTWSVCRFQREVSITLLNSVFESTSEGHVMQRSTDLALEVQNISSLSYFSLTLTIFFGPMPEHLYQEVNVPIEVENLHPEQPQ